MEDCQHDGGKEICESQDRDPQEAEGRGGKKWREIREGGRREGKKSQGRFVDPPAQHTEQNRTETGREEEEDEEGTGLPAGLSILMLKGESWTLWLRATIFEPHGLKAC